MALTGLEWRCWQGGLHSFLKTLGENLFSFQLLDTVPVFSFSLTATSSIFKASKVASLYCSFHCQISFSDSLLPPSSTTKDFCDCTGLTPTRRSVDLEPEFPCDCDLMSSQSPGVRTSWEPFFCLPQVLVTQPRLTLWDCMDCSLPGSSAHGIFQARILEWVAIACLPQLA